MFAVNTFAAPTDWIDQQKIRAAYFYGNYGVDKAELLKSKGINTMILKCKVDKALPWAKAAKRLGMKCFFACNFSVDAEKAGLRRAVLADGFVERYVCPLSLRFWREHFSKSIMQAAEYSTQPENEVTGLWIDFELYHETRSRYYTKTACYCDHCFGEFVRAQGREAPGVEPAKRQEWLQEQGLYDAYHPYLQERVEALAQELRERVHAVNPDFLLGFYPTPTNWSLVAVARGLSTPERPIVVWATDTYGGGGPKRVPDDWRESFAHQRIHARYCAGMLLRCYSATNLAANLYYATEKCNGYWLFTTYTLWAPAEKRPALYYLAHGAAEDYWHAIEAGNRAIKQRLHLGEAYKCPLTFRPEPTSFVKPGAVAPVDTSKLLPPRLTADAKLSPVEPRGEHQFLFYARKDESVRLVLAHRRVGSYNTGLSYTIFAPDNQIAAQGSVDLGKTGEVALAASAEGFYSLVGNAGSCSFSVTEANVPIALATRPKLHGIRAAGPLYFHVPKRVKQFALGIKGGGGRETAKLTVFTPGRAEAGAVALTRTRMAAKLTIPTKGDDDAIWSLTVAKSHEGILEDWIMTMDQQLPPLLSLSPEHAFKVTP